jgi:flagellar hook-associated protein 1
MSTFGGLGTAVSGLLAQQRAMDATGQNVVNANTPGYSRQRVVLGSVGAPVAASFQTGQSRNASVGGVSVDAVTRIHDAFTEATRAAAGGRQNALTSQTASLGSVQTLMSEPGDTGLQASIDSFYASWHELSLNPGDGAAGSVVLQRGIAVTDQLHTLSNGIAQQWNTARTNLGAVVAQANQASSDLATLNGKIQEGVMTNHPVNELLDQRDTLARKLAELVGGTVSQGPNGTVAVAVNGITVVSGSVAETLNLSGASALTAAAGNPPAIQWRGTTVPVESGSAAGYLATLKSDLPKLSGAIDQVAVALRDAVNTVHATGFTLTGTPGAAFFAGSGARDLNVVPTQPSDLAIVSAPNTIDGAVALKIGDLADDVTAAAALGGTPGASARWKSITTSLGVQLQSLNNASSIQDSVVSAADAAVVADSGVSIDEEMTNMMLYQRAYQASARVITTVDSMLDTLINHTGM